MRALLPVLILAPSVRADGDAPVPAATNTLERVYRERLERYAGNPDILVRPGLLADRHAGWVRIEARATGLAPGEPIEFLLIGPNSGHDYEASLVSFAQPSAVHHALEFIGLPPGRPVNPERLEFWPKGERVEADVLLPEGKKPPRRLPLGALLRDARTGKPLERTAWVFTGSPKIDAGNGKKVYAADLEEPGSIVSTYNEPYTVLDVPRLAAKSRVYGETDANPDLRLKDGQHVEVELRPERRAGPPRVLDLNLKILPAAEPPGVRFALSYKGQAQAPIEKTFEKTEALRAFIRGLVAKGRDPFVVIEPDPALELSRIQRACRVLKRLQDEEGLRIEPPPPGHLYYQAFLPNPDYRNRARRPSQPLEVHLRHVAEGLRGTLVRVRRKDDSDSYDETATPFRTPDEMKRLIENAKNPFRVLLLFVPADVAYGKLLPFLRPVLRDYPIQYLFLEAPPAEKQ